MTALIGLRTAWTELSGLCRNEGGTAFCISAEGKGLCSTFCVLRTMLRTAAACC